MAVLDGNAYDAKCLEAGHERDEDLESCSLLINNKGTALLQPGASASHSLQHKVVVQLQVRPPPASSALRPDRRADQAIGKIDRRADRGMGENGHYAGH